MSLIDIAKQSTRGSLALFVGNMATTIVSAAAIVLIARLLGPSLYGSYTLAILAPNILLNALGLGVNSGITRYAAYWLSRNDADAARRVTFNGLAFLFIFGALLSLASYLSAPLLATQLLHRPELVGLVRYSSLLIFAQSILQSVISAMLGWRYMGLVSISNVTQALVRLVLAIGLVVGGFGVIGALTGNIVSVFVAGLLGLVILNGRTKQSAAKWFDGFSQDIRKMLSFGVPIFVGQILLNLSAQYIIVLLANIASNSYVGYVQAASNVVTVITLTSSSMAQTLFPAFAHVEGTRGDVASAFRHATKYMGFILAPLVFFIMAAAPQLIGVLYTTSFTPATIYLTFWALSNIPMVLGYSTLTALFAGVGLPRALMMFNLVNAVLVFALAPLLGLVGDLGILGLIYAILLANGAAVVVGLVLANRRVKAAPDFLGAALILLSSLLAFVLTVLLQSLQVGIVSLLLIQAVFFAGVYLSVAPLLGAISAGDIRTLGAAIEGLGRFSKLLKPILGYERFILRLIGRL